MARLNESTDLSMDKIIKWPSAKAAHPAGQSKDVRRAGTGDEESTGAGVLQGVGTEADLLRAQRRFGERLSDTPAGRRLVELAYPEISVTANALVAEIHSLSDEMTDDEAGLRSTAAAVSLARVNRAAAYHHRTDLQHEPSRCYRWAQRWYRLADRVWRKEQPVRRASYWTRAAAAVGQLLTFGAALALLFQVNAGGQVGFMVAAGLIGARIAVTLAVWRYAHFPGDDDPNHPMLVTTPTSCVLDHAGDAAVVAAMGGALIATEHPEWGGYVIASAFLFVFATLFRVAGARYGTVVSRLHLERVTRSGAMLVSLVIAAAREEWWKASAVLMLVGPGLFALIEIIETRRALAARRGVLEVLPSPAQRGPAAGVPPKPLSHRDESTMV